MSARCETTPFAPGLRERHTPVDKHAGLRALALLQARKQSAGKPGSAVFSNRTWNDIIGQLGLSRREGEIARGVFNDQTEFAIATNLGISPHTVHTHFERLHKKLGVTDRVQLVISIAQTGLRLRAALRAR